MSPLMLGTSAVGGTVIYIALILAMLYFFFMRPQRKQQQTRDRMLNSLKPDTRIMTAGGITGYVRSIGDEFIYVEIADGLVIELLKTSVAKILDDAEASEEVEIREDEKGDSIASDDENSAEVAAPIQEEASDDVTEKE